MKAARVNRLGPPDVIAIETIAVPSPGERDVLVRVHAAGVVKADKETLGEIAQSYNVSRWTIARLFDPR